jgi:hypothetical protein
MASRVGERSRKVKTSKQKQKTAIRSLTGSFTKLVSEAKREMSVEEFQRAEQKFDQIVTKVRASRAPRRETA